MIPKIIHYCWFGKGKLPPLAVRCIKSWEDILPNYQLNIWNEESFDVNSHPFTREAWQMKKYAFVSDYVRLFALYYYGGIYMDTDVEVLKSLDDLLHLPGFSGFESDYEVPTGIMACEKSNEWAKEQLKWYERKHFISEEGKPDLTSNVRIISEIMSNNGLLLDNSYQIYKGCMHIFPKDYFCPKSRTGIISTTSNTYCIHHFAASWHPWHMKLKKYFFSNILGPKITDMLVRTKRSLLRKYNKQ